MFTIVKKKTIFCLTLRSENLGSGNSVVTCCGIKQTEVTYGLLVKSTAS